MADLILHLLAAALVAFVPAFLLENPLVVLTTPANQIFLGASALAYLICAAILHSRRRRLIPVRLFDTGILVAAVFFPVLVGLLILQSDASADAQIPKTLIVGAIGLAAVATVLFSWWNRHSVAKLTGLAALSALGILGLLASQLGWLPAALRPDSNKAVPPQKIVEHVDSALYGIKVTSYRHWIPKSDAPAGGISLFGEHNLLVTGDGDLYLFSAQPDDDALKLRKLALRVPMNAAEFIKDTRVLNEHFRVADILVQQIGGGLRLYASHHFWNHDKQCFVLRVSSVEATPAEFEQPGADRLPWTTLFDSTPCLPLKNARGYRFAGLEAGGRMALQNEHQLLLTIGDHEFDGWNSELDLAQDPAALYGKIMAINLDDRSAKIYSSGHRNPQGLYIDSDGKVWATEHGPRGGDELNLIEPGHNYGWPKVTYGTEYGLHSWPPSARQGSHDGYDEPIYSWVPSVAVSSLVQINSNLFDLWKGDLLIGSLRRTTLWRSRIRDGRVIFSEPIKISARIRDLMEERDGRIVIWTDRDLAFVELDKEGNSGEALFAQCLGCHQVDPEVGHSIGPNLHGIAGRHIASAADFDYSPSIKAVGGRWTDEQLDAFLSNPQAFAPGTTMQFPGVTEPKDRKAIVEFLHTIK